MPPGDATEAGPDEVRIFRVPPAVILVLDDGWGGGHGETVTV